MKPIINNPPEYYLDLLDKNILFSLIRAGDGEVMCCFPNGWLHINCDGSAFLPELNVPMRQIFKNQHPYYHCLLDCSFDLNGDKFKEFLEETCPDMQFYNGEIFQELAGNGRIRELIHAISLHHNPVFVGGSHFENIGMMDSFNKEPVHLQVPNKDSFKDIDKIISDISDLVDKGHRMFLFSCGYTSKILIDTLFPFIGNECFLLDMGSVFDPFLGILSRDGMKFRGFEYYQPFTKLKLT